MIIELTEAQWDILNSMIHSSMVEDWVEETIEDGYTGFTKKDLEDLQEKYPYIEE